MPKPNPFKKGEKFGRLTALGEHKSMNGGRTTYEKCICECGTIKWQNRNSIRSGKLISCGCARKEAGRRNLIKANFRHGMARTRIYGIYMGLLDRCRNKNNPSYLYYGGKGVRCLRESFEDFNRDMGDSYREHVKNFGEKDTTIDRIDSNGDYCKDNCRWATLSDQANNKKDTKIITYKGDTMSLRRMCNKYNKKYGRVQSRLNRGWAVKDAFEKESCKL